MKLYLDTEFNGFGGSLISMALVQENDDAWFYGELPLPSQIDPWVAEHVVPLMTGETMDRVSFRRGLHAFLQSFANPGIMCDWHADAAHLCQWMAGEDYGSSLDFNCQIVILKTPPGEPVSKTPHNALADARALRDWHLAAP